MDPWGMPQVNDLGEDFLPSIQTNCLRLER